MSTGTTASAKLVQEATKACMEQNAASVNLVEYRRGVETLMLLKSGQTISNSEPSHAAILFDVLFNNAQEKIIIFCKNLNKEVFDAPFLSESAKKALDRKVTIQIITQESKPDDSKFIQWLKTEPRVQLLATTSDIVKKVVFNFTVMDDSAFRFEEKNHKCEATASMNYPSTARTLAERFNQILMLGTTPVLR